MPRHGIVLLTIGATAIFALPGFAQAEEYHGPPSKGWEGGFRLPHIICDTKDQIRAISEAGVNSNEDLQKKFFELSQVKDDKDEPTCIIGSIDDVVVGESEEIGFSTDVAGVKVKAWAVHFGNQAGGWWMLYAERPEEPAQGEARKAADFKDPPHPSDLCAGRSISSYDPESHVRTFWCS
jgi:hypothetical protein